MTTSAISKSKMPSSKEDIALRWELSSEEEKNEKRKRHAEAQKRYREKQDKVF